MPNLKIIKIGSIYKAIYTTCEQKYFAQIVYVKNCNSYSVCI